MKAFRHTLYIISLAMMLWLLPYSFYAEERAGYAYAVVLFLVLVLYTTEQMEDVFERIKKDKFKGLSREDKEYDRDILGVDEDEDAQYR